MDVEIIAWDLRRLIRRAESHERIHVQEGTRFVVILIVSTTGREVFWWIVSDNGN